MRGHASSRKHEQCELLPSELHLTLISFCLGDSPSPWQEARTSAAVSTSLSPSSQGDCPSPTLTTTNSPLPGIPTPSGISGKTSSRRPSESFDLFELGRMKFCRIASPSCWRTHWQMLSSKGNQERCVDNESMFMLKGSI